MRFIAEGKENDILVETSGNSVVVDTKTALYLRGTTLDYSNKMVGGFFKFINQMLRRVVVVVKALIFDDLKFKISLLFQTNH